MKARRVASLAAVLWLWGAAVASTGLVPLQIGINSEEDAGSCGYGGLNTTGVIAGLFDSSSPLVAGLPAQGCGSCIQVLCDSAANRAAGLQKACLPGHPTVTFTIADTCSGCNAGVPEEAFSQIASTYVGNAFAQGQLVPCSVSGNLIARVSQFRSADGGYLKLTIINADGTGSLTSVELRSTPSHGQEPGAWMPMDTTWGATWEASALPSLPLDLRLTNAFKQTVVASPGLPVNPSGDVNLGVQFSTSLSPGGAVAQPVSSQPGVPQPGVSQPDTPEASVAPSPLQVTASDLKRRGVAVMRRRLLQFGVGLTDLLNAIFPEDLFHLQHPPASTSPSYPTSLLSSPPPPPLTLFPPPPRPVVSQTATRRLLLELLSASPAIVTPPEGQLVLEIPAAQPDLAYPTDQALNGLGSPPPPAFPAVQLLPSATAPQAASTGLGPPIVGPGQELSKLPSQSSPSVTLTPGAPAQLVSLLPTLPTSPPPAPPPAPPPTPPPAPPVAAPVVVTLPTTPVSAPSSSLGLLTGTAPEEGIPPSNAVAAPITAPNTALLSPPPLKQVPPPPLPEAPATAPVQAITPPSPLQVAGPVGSGPCRSIIDWIQESPSLSSFYSVLQSTGYDNSLDIANLTITLFAPTNDAFSAPVLQGTDVGSQTGAANVSTLLAAEPSSANPVIGYHILKTAYTTQQLTPGSTINTTDTLKQFGVPDESLSITVLPSGQIKGIGSTATIIDPNLPACGSIIHIVDTVLLPFSLSGSNAGTPGGQSTPAPAPSSPLQTTSIGD